MQADSQHTASPRPWSDARSATAHGVQPQYHGLFVEPQSFPEDFADSEEEDTPPLLLPDPMGPRSQGRA
ncbi:hypothetical protein [Streptomyces sp. NBC_00388]|uniref:hypothetical protein n=1 Tax=Streptomyces sp. NBC_00388 TaxID=2975735 RepID=UPI002E24DC58